MIQLSKIHFAELCNLNDNNSIVLSGITVDSMDSIEEVDNFFHNANLFSKDKHITEISRVTDNVLGEEGRSDLLLHLTEEGEINPLVRLGMRQSGLGVMWTSDFVSNYASDYAEIGN